MKSEPQRLAFQIHGMDCAEEVAVLKRELGPLVGGEDQLAFDILSGKLIVERGAAVVSADDVVRAVARTGMRAEVWRDATDRLRQRGFWEQHGRTVLTAGSGVFGLVGFLTHAWIAGGLSAALSSEGVDLAAGVPSVAIIFYLFGIAAGVWYVLPKAWRAAMGLRPDMNLLMTIAVVGAASIGEWFEAVTVAFLFSVSLLLESWSVGRARRAITALMDLTPPAARIRDVDGIERQLPPDQESRSVKSSSRDPARSFHLMAMSSGAQVTLIRPQLPAKVFPSRRLPGARCSLARSMATVFWKLNAQSQPATRRCLTLSA